MKMRIRFAIGLTLLMLGIPVIAGCVSDYHLRDSQTWETQLVMELWTTDDDSVEAGKTLKIKATLENSTDEDVEYTKWNIGDPPIYIQVVPPYGEPTELYSETDPETVLPAVEIDELKASDMIKRTVKWEIPEAAVNGTYEIQARFYPGDQVDLPTPEPLLVSQQLEVTEGVDIIGKDAVQSQVEDMTSVQLWKRGHTGAAVAREEKGDYLVNMGGEWQTANGEMYEEALEAGRHPDWRLTEEMPKQWTVRYYSKYGFEPSELEITVNALTGNVEDISPNLAAELEGGIVAAFEVQGSLFRVFVTNQETIDSLFALQRGESSSSIPNGPLLAGPGAGLHNAPWSWHLDPEKVTMADFTIEVCDGTPEFVESDLNYWLNTVGQYCPWTAKLVEIEDYR